VLVEVHFAGKLVLQELADVLDAMGKWSRHPIEKGNHEPAHRENDLRVSGCFAFMRR
jgi:hypothetical protein